MNRVGVTLMTLGLTAALGCMPRASGTSNANRGVQKMGETEYFVEVDRYEVGYGQSARAALHRKAAQVCRDAGYESYELRDRDEERSVEYEYREDPAIKNRSELKGESKTEHASGIVHCKGPRTAVAGAAPAAGPQVDRSFASYDRFDDRTFLGYCMYTAITGGTVAFCSGYYAPGEHTWEQRADAASPSGFTVSFEVSSSQPNLEHNHGVTFLVDRTERIKPPTRFDRRDKAQLVWLELDMATMRRIATAVQVEVRVGTLELTLAANQRQALAALVPPEPGAQPPPPTDAADPEPTPAPEPAPGAKTSSAR